MRPAISTADWASAAFSAASGYASPRDAGLRAPGPAAAAAASSAAAGCHDAAPADAADAGHVDAAGRCSRRPAGDAISDGPLLPGGALHASDEHGRHGMGPDAKSPGAGCHGAAVHGHAAPAADDAGADAARCCSTAAATAVQWQSAHVAGPNHSQPAWGAAADVEWQPASICSAAWAESPAAATVAARCAPAAQQQPSQHRPPRCFLWWQHARHVLGALGAPNRWAHGRHGNRNALFSRTSICPVGWQPHDAAPSVGCAHGISDHDPRGACGAVPR
mmetsp:Transcript_12913/g.39060  ORF Transcript_12913/g.39060 Transcript_12913/m.39060 type:complete len:277 (-) Transcript_12913:1362-2192(-)